MLNKFVKAIIMCNFSINFNSDSAVLISKAQKAITNAGGQFNGDAASGSFSLSSPMGKIAGSYMVRDNTISMNIAKKPMLVPCKMIEDKLREYLLSAG